MTGVKCTNNRYRNRRRKRRKKKSGLRILAALICLIVLISAAGVGIWVYLNPVSRRIASFEQEKYDTAVYQGAFFAQDLCVAAGDVQLAAQRSAEAGLGEIKYVIPKEGALMGYDMFAIPKDAQNKDNAYKFLDYIMRPEVIAEISNYVRYANANKDALPLIDADIRNNPGIYYPSSLLERMHIVVPPTKMERTLTRTWNRVRAEASE